MASITIDICLALLFIITADLLLADELTTVSPEPLTTADTSGRDQIGVAVRASTKFESREEVVGVGGKAGSVVYRPYTHQDQRVYYQYPYQQPA